MTDTATIIDPKHSPNGDTLDELSAAVRKAGSWEVAFRPNHAGTFHERVLARRRELLKLERELASLPNVRRHARCSYSGITAAR